jgi:hypothetical protein
MMATQHYQHQPKRSAGPAWALALAALLSLHEGQDVAAFVAPELSQETSAAPEPALIAWTTGAGKWVGYWGRRETVRCPAGGTLEGAWGTDVYTDDSSICTAAVHAGLIAAKAGGVVTIEMRPDVGQYSGSARNGVRTGDWMEPWTGAYVFVRNHTTVAPAIAAGSLMQAASWPGQAGRILTFACGPNFELHTVYGTDVYTDDSYICSAAVHRGLITQKNGGMVTIKLLQGETTFVASSRHGVTSLSQESWQGQSYAFVATPPDTPAPPTPDTPFDRAPAGGDRPPDSGAQL